MGKLKVIRANRMTTIQDFGRFGFRKYGIPQSGAMDKEMMITANQLVGNPGHFPVIEVALSGLKFEAIEPTTISVVGARLIINGKAVENVGTASRGDEIAISPPLLVYAYVAIGGKVEAKEDFGSVSTYERAGFGGKEGRSLKSGDILYSKGEFTSEKNRTSITSFEEGKEIRIMKGPEWSRLKELPDSKVFKVDASSDRMGVRLSGPSLNCDYEEIDSSAVIPGTIQLPPDGHPIILMNDCQTTGGYPRVGKVLESDLGKLAQIRAGKEIRLKLAD